MVNARTISNVILEQDKLSPILFNLFINELIEELKLSGIQGYRIQISADGSDILAILYADDMANVSDNVRS